MFARLVAYFTPTTDTEPAGAKADRTFANFQFVLDAEHKIIGERRGEQGRTPLPKIEPDMNKKGDARRPMYETAGICLSGGGIRSAAFCLGALQSLAVEERFDRFDYLSTVSGGGYTGSGVTAAMSDPDAKSATEFPFAEPKLFDDNPALGHLRDYSNYILPRGHTSLGDAIAIIVRGLATNVVFVLSFVLMAAGVTHVAYPLANRLLDGSFVSRFILGFFGLGQNEPAQVALGDYPFALTVQLFIAMALYMCVWALFHSFGDGKANDVRGRPIVLGRTLIRFIAICAFLDFQPVAISVLCYLKSVGLSHAVALISATAAPFAGVIAFFSSRIAAFVKQSQQTQGAGAMIARISSLAVMFVAAIVLPLILWIFYLWVAAASMPDSGFAFAAPVQHSLDRLAGLLWGSYSLALFLIGAVLMVLTWFFDPNANSLHQLYRDKLSKAFLFNPGVRWTKSAAKADDDDLIAFDNRLLSAISPKTGGPYHLVNATLNLQGSVEANRRGRGASFFLFSSAFTGSDPTGFAETTVVEGEDPHIDLAAAMAISGAALSSDMGSLQTAPLAPTLALLNLRLGYWMDNPLYMPSPLPFPPGNDPKVKKPGLISRLAKGYLFSEMFGLLDERAAKVYLTDGGHLENLGLYQLLKRHCRVIFVVDGEADPQLSFHALAIAQRYARIDLGVRIDLPWQGIADVANKATELAQKGEPIPPTGGPHCAVGSILYPGGEKGVIVYVKASLTGDEPDYVVDYKMRNPIFPHESTGDQFFTEEQFEVYRALGFHALDGFLTDGRKFTCNKTVMAAAATAGKTVPQYVQDQLVS